MKERFLEFLNHYDKKMVSLDVLEQLCPGDCDYERFSLLVQELATESILSECAPRLRSPRDERLCLKYHVNKYQLRGAERRQIQQACLQARFPETMDLSYYFQAGLKEWEADFAYLQKIADYLRRQGLPRYEATDQERSYEIFSDEKVLLGSRRKILRKLRLDEAMKIVAFPEPLMAAVQPAYLQTGPFRHLIVENKAVYYALLPLLPEAPPASLIYGAGWKIAGNLGCLPRQFNLASGEHQYYYFGDFDEEGIAIWYTLQKRYAACLAAPFYLALLDKPYSIGKQNQAENKSAKDCFLAQFLPGEAETMRNLLMRRAYYPQECLTREDLCNCLRRLAAEWK